MLEKLKEVLSKIGNVLNQPVPDGEKFLWWCIIAGIPVGFEIYFIVKVLPDLLAKLYPTLPI